MLAVRLPEGGYQLGAFGEPESLWAVCPIGQDVGLAHACGWQDFQEVVEQLLVNLDALACVAAL